MSRFKKSTAVAVVETYEKHRDGGHVSLHDCEVLHAFFYLAIENKRGQIPWTDVSLENAEKIAQVERGEK